MIPPPNHQEMTMTDNESCLRFDGASTLTIRPTEAGLSRWGQASAQTSRPDTIAPRIKASVKASKAASRG